MPLSSTGRNSQRKFLTEFIAEGLSVPIGVHKLYAPLLSNSFCISDPEAKYALLKQICLSSKQ